MNTRKLIDLSQLTLSEVDDIAALALKIKENPQNYMDVCHGKVMATLFYEPSTRTQMSFQTAMLRLGGQTIGFDNPVNSSVAKGENLKDTISIISGYADLVVMRNPREGAALAASLFSKSPLINAGDGGHLHPTQTLTDVVTLLAEKGTLSGLTIGLCGDMKNGRTVHSLIKYMSQYKNNRFIMISTPELEIPQYIKDVLDAAGCDYSFVNDLESVIDQLDVLYMTRIQRERFQSEEEYQAQKGVFVLDMPKLRLAKPDLKVLHPLPRVDEIAIEVDDDPRAVYFKQAEYGMYARMALIIRMLEQSGGHQEPRAVEGSKICTCTNPRCVTRTEPYLPQLFIENGDMMVCRYCDERVLI